MREDKKPKINYKVIAYTLVPFLSHKIDCSCLKCIEIVKDSDV